MYTYYFLLDSDQMSLDKYTTTNLKWKTDTQPLYYDGYHIYSTTNNSNIILPKKPITS